MTWLIPIWTLALAGLIAWRASGRFKEFRQAVAAMLATLGVIPLLPSSHAESLRQPTKQVIYRFDGHRHLELEGYACEGAIYYVDPQRDVRTPYIEQFGRVFLPRIVHADNDGDFIFIPYSDASAFAVSKDGGRTFQDARWVGNREFGVEEITAVTVVNRQAFIQTKDGRLFMTSKPFGKHWGMGVVDPIKELPSLTYSDLPEFQGLPKQIPTVKDYKGWTEMHCDPDLQGEAVETLGTRWNGFQAAVLDGLAKTIAWPVAAVVGQPGHLQ